jgi:hypothetical protein
LYVGIHPFFFDSFGNPIPSCRPNLQSLQPVHLNALKPLYSSPDRPECP